MSENKQYEGFTLSMALVDAIPVLVFGASCILVGMIFKSPLFITGAVLAFLAGFLKVMWKVVLGISGKDVKWLNKQFRYLMIGGWVLIIASLIIGRKNISFSAMGAAVTSMPSLVFFILGALGMVTMGVLGKKLDPTVAKNNWIEQSVNCVAQSCIFLGLLFIFLDK